jgi:hypothetical protein
MKPTVFISYTWQDDAEKEWVHKFAHRLTENDIDVTLDQWALHLGDPLTSFMEQSIAKNDYVLIICTPRYKERSEKREGGVGYEGDIMTAELFLNKNHRKFIPVLRNGNWMSGIPSWLAGKYAVDLRGAQYSEQQFTDLLSAILNKAVISKLASVDVKEIQEESAVTAVHKSEESKKYEPVRITRMMIEDATVPRNDGTRGSALYLIPFKLNRRPSSHWSKLFEQTWDHPPEYTTMHRPRIATVVGDRINLNGTSVEEVEKYHRKTLLLVVDRVNELDRAHNIEQQRVDDLKNRELEEHKRKLKEASERIKFELTADEIIKDDLFNENLGVQTAINKYQEKIRNVLPDEYFAAIGIKKEQEFEVIDNSVNPAIKDYRLHGSLKLGGTEVPIYLQSTHYSTRDFTEGRAFLTAKLMNVRSAYLDFHANRESNIYHEGNIRETIRFLRDLKERLGS